VDRAGAVSGKRFAGEGEMSKTEILNNLWASDAFTKMEKKWLTFQWGEETSSFRKSLWNVLLLSDEENLERLARGFSEEVLVLRLWRHGDLAKRARDHGVMD